jgi:NADP-dependent 3-hydroxy acid dehydrogenase YdfG
VAVVTGGAHGFGQHIVAALAEAGARLVVTGRDATALADLSRTAHSAGWAAVTQAGDVRDHATATAVIDRAVESYGRVDVLVNNAGTTGPIGPTWEVDSDDWWQAMEVNTRGSLLFIRAALPVMTDRGTGTIINIVSSAGWRRFPHLSAYSVSKAAVIKLGRTSVVNWHPLTPEYRSSACTRVSSATAASPETSIGEHTRTDGWSRPLNGSRNRSGPGDP